VVPAGASIVDAWRLVVGPGFIDLHGHVRSIAGHRLQAFDGVATALDLEAGLAPVEVAPRRAAEEGRALHLGFSASWCLARAQCCSAGSPTPPSPRACVRWGTGLAT